MKFLTLIPLALEALVNGSPVPKSFLPSPTLPFNVSSNTTFVSAPLAARKVCDVCEKLPGLAKTVCLNVCDSDSESDSESDSDSSGEQSGFTGYLGSARNGMLDAWASGSACEMCEELSEHVRPSCEATCTRETDVSPSRTSNSAAESTAALARRNGGKACGYCSAQDGVIQPFCEETCTLEGDFTDTSASSDDDEIIAIHNTDTSEGDSEYDQNHPELHWPDYYQGAGVSEALRKRFAVPPADRYGPGARRACEQCDLMGGKSKSICKDWCDGDSSSDFDWLDHVQGGSVGVEGSLHEGVWEEWTDDERVV